MEADGGNSALNTNKCWTHPKIVKQEQTQTSLGWAEPSSAKSGNDFTKIDNNITGFVSWKMNFIVELIKLFAVMKNEDHGFGE